MSYVDQVLEELKKKNPNEPEFHQAATEILASIAPVFEKHPDLTLPLVDGVSMHHSNSFPAGHTATFFVFFTCCALLMAYQYWLRTEKNNGKTWVLMNVGLLGLLTLAALGGYSRIYLSQHFLMDVCVGSIIGFLVPCFVFFLYGKKILKIKNLDGE